MVCSYEKIVYRGKLGEKTNIETKKRLLVELKVTMKHLWTTQGKKYPCI